MSGFDLAHSRRRRSGRQHIDRHGATAGSKTKRTPGAGGALFDIADPISDDDMWSAYEYFVSALVPVAERGRGPAWPCTLMTLPCLRSGAWRGSFDPSTALKRCVEISPDPGSGIELCLGTVSEMGGEGAVLDAIRYLAPRDKIAYVHLRDVKGTVPDFRRMLPG